MKKHLMTGPARKSDFFVPRDEAEGNIESLGETDPTDPTVSRGASPPLGAQCAVSDFREPMTYLFS